MNTYTANEIQEAIRQYGSQEKAAAELGITRAKLRWIMGKAVSPVTAEPLPPDDIPVEELVSRMVRDYTVKAKYHEAENNWRKHSLPIDGPFAIMWFGDPHLDDNACNWPVLMRDIAIAKSDPAILPANMGDTLNNWVGGLQKLYAHQNVSESRALKLYQWLLDEVPWWLWLFGNHCLWPTHNAGVMRQLALQGNPTALGEWNIKVALELPCGRQLKINAAHNFKGHSRFNKLHSLQLESMESGAEADIVIAGDHHVWATAQGEHEKNANIYNLIRARGYKGAGQYERMNGFGSMKYGHAVMTVIDPRREGPGFVTTFADAEYGALVLRLLREDYFAGQVKHGRKNSKR